MQNSKNSVSFHLEWIFLVPKWNVNMVKNIIKAICGNTWIIISIIEFERTNECEKKTFVMPIVVFSHRFPKYTKYSKINLRLPYFMLETMKKRKKYVNETKNWCANEKHGEEQDWTCSIEMGHHMAFLGVFVVDFVFQTNNAIFNNLKKKNSIRFNWNILWKNIILVHTFQS